ncbi:MAG: methyltransferase domain-containing protein [Calditerrivibrio sp.]|nr:methyltransferase domain-containing protein [Calditerrivibrio sp.]
MIFDKDAISYDSKQMHAHRAAVIANEIKNAIPIDKDWIMADFGCGTGFLGLNFVNTVKHIDMFDTSENMLAILKEKIVTNNISNVNIKMFDIFKDNIRVNRYHLIISLMVLHHIKDLAGAIHRLSNMVKKNGFLALSDLDKEDGSYHEKDKPPHNGIDQTLLTEISVNNGMELVYCSTPYTVEKNKRSYPIFLHIYQKL